MENKISDLKKDIFEPVTERIIDHKKDSLTELGRFKSMGIEGWLKVEVIAALGSKIKKVQNRGPDLVFEGLEGEIEIELKAATGFQFVWARGGVFQDKAPCLFLGEGNSTEMIEKIQSDESIELIGYKTFEDGRNEWVIAMIKPATG